MKKRKILFGIPPKNHIVLAMDEVQGFQELGYICETTAYSRNNENLSFTNKLYGVIINALKIIYKLYKFKPDFLYLNSRFGLAGCARDFITTFLIRIFYWKKLAIVIKTHGSDLFLLSQLSFLFHKIIIPYLTSNVAIWFFLSNEERNSIEKYKSELGKKSFVTQNIIDPKRSIVSKEFKAKYNLDDDRFIFFFAGRMIREKGIFTIINSIPLFKEKDKCLFLFTGDGEDFQEFQAEIERLKVEQYIKLTGFVPDLECDHFYANVDALVFPTYFAEGFPMALFKSIGQGLPVITTKTRAALDYLKEPDNCIWVDGKSEVTVTKALKQIYSDNTLRERMSTANQKLSEKFIRSSVCIEMNLVFQKHIESQLL